MNQPPLNVLFLCTGNSARSIIAEAIINREFAGPGALKLDFVFTVCDDAAAQVCPIWPGQPMTAHWGLPDPAAATGSPAEVALAFAEAYRMINNRITLFMSLPMATLDKLSLQRRLDEIGQRREATHKA